MYCVLYLLLLLYCYFSRVQSDARWFRQTLFVGFVTYVLLYIAAPAYPYWVVLAIPFMTMLVHTSGGLYGLDTLLSELFEDSLLLYSYVYYHWCYSSESVVRGVTYSILGSRHPFPVNMGTYISDLWNAIFGWDVTIMLRIVFTVFGCAMIAVNVPREQGLSRLEYKYNSLYVRLKMFAGLVLILIPISVYIGVALFKPSV